MNYFLACNPLHTDKKLQAFCYSIAIPNGKIFCRATSLSSTNSNPKSSPCRIHWGELSNSLHIPSVRKTFHSNSFFPRTIILWNWLPRGVLPIATVWTSSSLRLTIIYTTYPHKLQFLIFNLIAHTTTSFISPLPHVALWYCTGGRLIKKIPFGQLILQNV